MKLRIRHRPWSWLLVSLLLPHAKLAAQVVSARAVVALPKSSVRLGEAIERVNGVWGGLAFDVGVGRLRLTGTGTRGQLTAAGEASTLEQDVGEMSLTGRYQLVPSLEVDLRYAARAIRSAAGRSRWDLFSGGLTASHQMGVPNVRAFAGLAYTPVITATGPEPRAAWSSQVGILVASGQSPILVGLEYRVERFQFPRLVDRSEQFEALTLTIGVQFHRLDGRWAAGGREE